MTPGEARDAAFKLAHDQYFAAIKAEEEAVLSTHLAASQVYAAAMRPVREEHAAAEAAARQVLEAALAAAAAAYEAAVA